MRTASRLVAASVLAALLAACGDDQSASSSGGGAGHTSTTTTASTSTSTSVSSGGQGGGQGGGGGDGQGGGDGGGDGGGATAFAQRTVYAHLIEPFETEQECLDAQDPEFFINCYQVVEFCADGSATLLLTDILDSGTYTRGEEAIETSWSGASGAPPEMSFTIVSPTELVDDAYEIAWTLDAENTHALSDCE